MDFNVSRNFDFTYSDLLQQIKSLNFINQAFINGQYVDAQSQKTFSCVSPRDGSVLTEVASCEQADVDLAVACAKKSFHSGVWANMSPVGRKKILLKLADLIEENALEFSLLETLDMGKPIAYSFHHDVVGTVANVRWLAECIDKLYDEIAPTSRDALALITREPCGVVGCVTPWNFPLYLACAKVIPALAVGNSVVIKPAEQSPLSTLKLAELMTEAGIPDGVFNVIPGFGETAGQALGLHKDVDVLSFTGSTEVGRMFLRYSADSNMKRVLLECGGKSPNIIMTDCKDLDYAVQIAANVFYNQGEVCTARSRLLVDKSIQAAVLEKLSHTCDRFVPSDPLDPDTKMGAMVDETQMQRVLEYINIGEQEGAEKIRGGNRVKKDTGGYYIEPTIFSNVKNSMRIAQEEIFGPVVSVIGFDNLDEAIEIANDTSYGLAASLWTQDINKALTTARALRSGSVSINAITSGNETTPFGGYKQSGIGREGSLHGFYNYTELKTTWISLT